MGQARVDSFFQTWVCKEAFIKATGRGLGYGLQRSDVSVSGETASLELHGGDGEWGLSTVDADGLSGGGGARLTASWNSKLFEDPESESNL